VFHFNNFVISQRKIVDWVLNMMQQLPNVQYLLSWSWILIARLYELDIRDFQLMEIDPEFTFLLPDQSELKLRTDSNISRCVRSSVIMIGQRSISRFGRMVQRDLLVCGRWSLILIEIKWSEFITYMNLNLLNGTNRFMNPLRLIPHWRWFAFNYRRVKNQGFQETGSGMEPSRLLKANPDNWWKSHNWRCSIIDHHWISGSRRWFGN
jgi:hypothetical protein